MNILDTLTGKSGKIRAFILWYVFASSLLFHIEMVHFIYFVYGEGLPTEWVRLRGIAFVMLVVITFNIVIALQQTYFAWVRRKAIRIQSEFDSKQLKANPEPEQANVKLEETTPYTKGFGFYVREAVGVGNAHLFLSDEEATEKLNSVWMNYSFASYKEEVMRSSACRNGKKFNGRALNIRKKFERAASSGMPEYIPYAQWTRQTNPSPTPQKAA